MVWNVGLWHRAQPVDVNSSLPCCALAVNAIGCGASTKRMNMVNISQAGMSFVGWVNRSSSPRTDRGTSNGSYDRLHESTSLRMIGKRSLLMPISTLYASPAKMLMEPFCAFQPNREIVPLFGT